MTQPQATKRGFTYPLTVEDGGLKLSEDLNLTHEHTISTIETRPFERIMRPTLGTPELIFSSVYDINLIIEQFQQALETQVIGVDSWRLSGDIKDDGVFNLTINYTVSSIPQPPIQYRLIT